MARIGAMIAEIGAMIVGTIAETVGTVTLYSVVVHEYRNDVALVSGPKAGELVVIAGVQKMAPGLRVALPQAVRDEGSSLAPRAGSLRMTADLQALR